MTKARIQRFEGARQRRQPAKVSRFARLLMSEWRRLKLPTTEVGLIVAVSGGADSVALLLSLDQLMKARKLNVKIHVAHLNHKLRGKASDADARWVRGLSRRLCYPIELGTADLKRRARSGQNLEQAARLARYKFLARCAKTHNADYILTAHTLDDQAETVLMNLLRGSGVEGLKGVEPVRPLSDNNHALLVRPFIQWAHREDTEGFCKSLGVSFRHDAMNSDETFVRVRVRKRLMPLMQTFNPKIVEGLARTAEVLREDNRALESAASRLLELSMEDSNERSRRKSPAPLRIDVLRLAQPSLRRRALRRWISKCRGDLKRLERAHIVAADNLLFGERGGRVAELPGGAKISRRRGLLYFEGEM